MSLVNEKVEHAKFGFGVVTEVSEHRIYVKFQDGEIGDKAFSYPEAFEKFLKVGNSKVESNVREELRIKQAEISKEREQKAIDLREKLESIVPEKKKSSSRTTKKETSK